MAFGDVRNEVWVKSPVDGQEVPVAAVDHSRWGPVWFPDGVHLVYERRELKIRERQLILWSSRSHDEEPITTLSNTPIPAWDWSRDGKWLLVCDGEGGISMVPVASAPHAESAAKKDYFRFRIPPLPTTFLS